MNVETFVPAGEDDEFKSVCVGLIMHAALAACWANASVHHQDIGFTFVTQKSLLHCL